MITILLIVLLVMMIAGAPQVGWQPYGYWPSSAVGVVLVVLLILLLLGKV